MKPIEPIQYNQPNTRARIEARRKARSQRYQSAVIPGTRRVLGGWFQTGRVLSLAILLVAVGALTYMAASPQYTVQAIEVSGNQALSRQKVVTLADVDHHPIWLVDTAAIAAQIKTSAYVEDVQVVAELPDRLAIVITERQPEIQWRSGGNLYLLDATGRVLDIDAGTALSQTLVIDDVSGKPLQPNDQVDTDALALARLLALRLPAEVGLTPQSLSWGAERGIAALLPDSRTVIFGDSERLDDKLHILTMLLADKTPFTFLDLRPSTPFYRTETGN